MQEKTSSNYAVGWPQQLAMELIKRQQLSLVTKGFDSA